MTNIKGSVIIIAFFFLQGCTTAVVKFLGIGGAVEGAAGATVAVEIAETLDQAKTIGDAISWGNTGKTLTDHAISKYTGKDCRTFNILKEKEICEEVNKDQDKGK